MLSASISNAEEIADWLREVRGVPCQIVTKKVRPVELRYGFLHPEFGVIPLGDGKGEVFNEVSKFYGGSDLDPSGRRLKGEFGRHRGERRGGGRGDRRHFSRNKRRR